MIDGSAEDKKDFQVTLEPRTVKRTVTGLVRRQIRGLESGRASFPI